MDGIDMNTTEKIKVLEERQQTLDWIVLSRKPAGSFRDNIRVSVIVYE